MLLTLNLVPACSFRHPSWHLPDASNALPGTCLLLLDPTWHLPPPPGPGRYHHSHTCPAIPPPSKHRTKKINFSSKYFLSIHSLVETRKEIVRAKKYIYIDISIYIGYSYSSPPPLTFSAIFSAASLEVSQCQGLGLME
jgi:hypothetical protein